MYYPEESYNGVLLFLREPHVSEKDKNLPEEQITAISDRWVDKILHGTLAKEDLKDEKNPGAIKATAARYRNRIGEFLRYIEKSERVLPDIAYENLYKKGGEANQSKEYKEALKNYAQSDFEDLLEKLDYKTRYIFTCRDIYAKLKGLLNITEEYTGLQYQNRKPFHCFTFTDSKSNAVKVYEIFHPCCRVRLKEEA